MIEFDAKTVSELIQELSLPNQARLTDEEIQTLLDRMRHKAAIVAQLTSEDVAEHEGGLSRGKIVGGTLALELNERWAVLYDRRQWILAHKVRTHTDQRHPSPYGRGIWFGVEKKHLLRRVEELCGEVEMSARQELAAWPDHFVLWYVWGSRNLLAWGPKSVLAGAPVPQDKDRAPEADFLKPGRIGLRARGRRASGVSDAEQSEHL